MSDASSAARRLDMVPQFLTLQDAFETVMNIVNSVPQGKATLPNVSENFSKIAKLLKQLSCREFSDPCIGCTILHQIHFMLLQTRSLCEQYADETRLRDCLFQEVYIYKWECLLERVRVITEFLGIIVAKASLKKLPQIEGPKSTIIGSTQSTCFLPECSKSLVHTLLSEIDANPDNEFVAAAVHGRWLELEKLLVANPIHCNDFGGVYSLLHMSVLWEDPFAVAMLADCGANIDVQTRGASCFPASSTALHLASRLGNADLMNLLIAWGANLQLQDAEGQRAEEVSTTDACKKAFTAADQMQEEIAQAFTFVHERNFTHLQQLIYQHPIPLNVKPKVSSRLFLIHRIAQAGDAATYVLLMEAGASALLRTTDGLYSSELVSNNSKLSHMMEMYQDVERHALNPKVRSWLLHSNSSTNAGSPVLSPTTSPTTSPSRRSCHLLTDDKHGDGSPNRHVLSRVKGWVRKPH